MTAPLGCLEVRTNEKNVRTLGWKSLLEILSIFFSRLDCGKPRCFGKGLALCVPKIGLLDGVGGKGVRECCFRQDVPSEKGRGGVRALSQKQVRDLEKRDIAGDCKECGVCTRSGQG